MRSSLEIECPSAQPSASKCIWSALPWHLWWWPFWVPRIPLFSDSTARSGSQIREATVASRWQAELSDNRWGLECLPELFTQEECVHACMHACAALYLMTDPSWKGTADALWNMLEDDYNGEWLSLSLSSVSASPPTPSPSLLFLASLPFSTRGQVSPRLRCQGCQSPTQWVQGNCCQGNSDSVARHLELCSQ